MRVSAFDVQVEDFVEHIGTQGLYGFKLDTVDSLILSLLPPVDFEFHCTREQSLVDPTEDVKLFMLRLLVQCLRRCSGLHIPYVCPLCNVVCTWEIYPMFAFSVQCVCVCTVMYILELE